MSVDLAYEAGLIRAAEERGVGADERDQAASFEAQRELAIYRYAKPESQ